MTSAMPAPAFAGSPRVVSRVRGIWATTFAPHTRLRRLQLVLAVIWLLDAGLQFQPFMFSRAFPASLAASAPGNPAVIADPIHWTASLVASHVVVFNTGFAVVQLLLAVGIFWPRTLRLALGASVVWSLAVWWLGEGFGGILSGASPVMGAPGAVILYAVAALLLWPRAEAATGDSVATSGPLGPIAARFLWLLLWGSFTYSLLLPANRSPQATGNAVAAMADGEPGWLRAVDRGIANALAGHGLEASIALALCCAVVGLSVVSGRTARAGIVLALAVAAALWVAEDFGTILTSQATDPDTGPLLALLAAAFWPVTSPYRQDRTSDVSRARAALVLAGILAVEATVAAVVWFGFVAPGAHSHPGVMPMPGAPAAATTGPSHPVIPTITSTAPASSGMMTTGNAAHSGQDSMNPGGQMDMTPGGQG